MMEPDGIEKFCDDLGVAPDNVITHYYFFLQILTLFIYYYFILFLLGCNVTNLMEI